MAGAKGSRVVLECPEQLMMTGDPGGITRLISVLCDNAVKYAPPGDEIRFTLKRSGQTVLIETENTAPETLSPEKLKHLFDRFYRADDSRSREGASAGFGIGLAIAQAVAQQHGGDASAQLKNDRLVIRCRIRG